MAKKIEDMSEEELSSKSGKAYDKAMPEPDTTFNSSKKTPARKVAEQMETERTYPMAAKLAKKLSDTPLEERKAGHALQSGMGIPYAMGVDMLTGPKRRSNEDMSELTREVAKGNKMAAGGTASSRADGCAQRGKTRGTIIQ